MSNKTPDVLSTHALLESAGGTGRRVTITGAGTDEVGRFAYVTLRHVRAPRTSLSWDHYIVRSPKALKAFCLQHSISFEIHPRAVAQLKALASTDDAPLVQVPMPTSTQATVQLTTTPTPVRVRDSRGRFTKLPCPANLPTNPNPVPGYLCGVLDGVPTYTPEEVAEALTLLNTMFPLTGERAQMRLPMAMPV